MDVNKDIKKENSFRVPDNYFDYLPQEITGKIKSQTQSIPVFTLRPAVSYLSLALLSFFVFLLINFYKHPSAEANATSLTENDIQQIIDNPSLYNIDENSAADEYLSSAPDASTDMEEDFSDEEIKSFLEENNNATSIINEL
jgi:hypothetical protein